MRAGQSPAREVTLAAVSPRGDTGGGDSLPAAPPCHSLPPPLRHPLLPPPCHPLTLPAGTAPRVPLPAGCHGGVSMGAMTGVPPVPPRRSPRPGAAHARGGPGHFLPRPRRRRRSRRPRHRHRPRAPTRR